MNQYRDLNKELVEQVQTLRRNMKLYCDEIVHLKGELMQKHESEVMLRTHCYNWAVNNFLQLIQYVQPESDILSILKEHLQSQDKASSSTGGRTWRSRTSAEKSSNARSSYIRGSSLNKELQRSNSIINLSKSVYSTSPVRSANAASNENEEEQLNLQYFPQDAELEKTMGAADNEQLQNPDMGNIIYEEELEEDNTGQDLEVESVCDSVEEVSIISQTRSTLKDVTNTLNNTVDSPDKELINQSTDIRKNVEQRIITSRMKDMRILVNTASVSSDETLQEPREHIVIVRHESETNKSIPISRHINKLQDRESINSPSSIFTDMTLAHFKDVACSTPNSRQNSLIKVKTTSTCETESSVLSEATNISSRPSRQCKPINLAEPKLKNKLRNDSETKTKREKRSKSKTKK